VKYPISFFVRPGKTLLGLDKSEAFCFVVPKIHADTIMGDNGMGKSGIMDVELLVDGEPHAAEFRWTTQDGSRPYKREIERNWGDGRRVLFIQFGASRFKSTQDAVRRLLPESTKRLMRAQRPKAETMLVRIDEGLDICFDVI
jgi:hypothetical protein